MVSPETVKSPNDSNDERVQKWDMSDAPEMSTDQTNLVDVIGGDQVIDAKADQTSDTEAANEAEPEDSRVESLAARIARDYAEKNYPRKEDGTFEPAWRGKKGESDLKNQSPEDIVAKSGGEIPIEEAREMVIDIANQPYEEYSEHWKKENRAAAKFLVDLMDERGADTIADLDLTNDEIVTEYGGLIHDAWLDRNKDWAASDPVLSRPFAELPQDEKDKDIDQLKLFIQFIKDQGSANV